MAGRKYMNIYSYIMAKAKIGSGKNGAGAEFNYGLEPATTIVI